MLLLDGGNRLVVVHYLSLAHVKFDPAASGPVIMFEDGRCFGHRSLFSSEPSRFLFNTKTRFFFSLSLCGFFLGSAPSFGLSHLARFFQSTKALFFGLAAGCFFCFETASLC